LFAHTPAPFATNCSAGGTLAPPVSAPAARLEEARDRVREQPDVAGREPAERALELVEAGHELGQRRDAALGLADERGRRGADALDGLDAGRDFFDVDAGM
jgi:hypothetical protein